MLDKTGLHTGVAGCHMGPVNFSNFSNNVPWGMGRAPACTQVAATVHDRHPYLLSPPAPQVFCNGLVPTVLAVAYGVLAGCVDVPLGPSPQVEAWRAQLITALAGGFLGYYAVGAHGLW